MKPGGRGALPFRRTLIGLLGACLLGAGVPAALAQQDQPSVFDHPDTPPLITADPPDTLSLEEFRDPPMWARPQAYWLPSPTTEIGPTLEQLRTFKEMGLGGVTLEPGGPFDSADLAGPHVGAPGWKYKYLSPEWFEFVQAFLDEAEKLGLTTYMLDVPFTMSGSAQGQVAQPTHGGDPKLGWTSLAEVVPGQRYESITRPYWLDPLNPDAVQRVIDRNYAPHYEHVGEHFGKTLQAMWSDEVGFQPTASPGTFRGVELPVTGGNWQKEIPWSPTFPAYFRELKGYELTPERLQWVFEPDPTDPAKRKVAYDYWDAVSRRFADVYYGGLSRWSADKGLGFIGQLLGEGEPNSHFAIEGSYYRAASKPTVQSLDLINESSFDEAGLPFCGDEACYGTIQKFASSAAHLFGRKRVHLEAYDLLSDEIKHRPQTLKALIDHSISRGVNLIAYHSYDYGGGNFGYNNALFNRQRIWNDYTGRLQYLFSPGVTVPDVAVGYPIESYWIGDRLDKDAFALVSAALRSGDYEYDYFPTELLDDPATTVESGTIRFGDRTFPTFVVPDWSTISLTSMTKLRDFVAGGGTLAAVGRIPRFAIGAGADDEALGALVEEVFGFRAGSEPAAVTTHALGSGHAVWMPGDYNEDMEGLTPERAHALDPFVDALQAVAPSRVRTTGDPELPSGLSAVEVLPYRRADSDFYFVSNFPKWADKPPGRTGFPKAFPGQEADFTLEVPATGIPELWDAETGDVTPIVHYTVANGRISIPLDLPEFGSAAIRLAPGDPATTAHVTDTNLIDVAIVDNLVTGYLSPGEEGSPYAVVVRGQKVSTVTGSAPEPTSEELDLVYNVDFEDGHPSQQRRVGPWWEPQPETGASGRHLYTGSATYSATLELPEVTNGARALLDLGLGVDVIDVAVNGVDVGTRAWPDYVFDLGPGLQAGPDELSILVDPSHAAGLVNDPRLEVGLLGPVSVSVEPKVVLKLTGRNR